jgi:hypothetical protein
MATEAAANKAIIVLRNIIVLRKIRSLPATRLGEQEIVAAVGEVDRPASAASIKFFFRLGS